VRPDARPDARPDVRLDARPDVRLDARTDVRIVGGLKPGRTSVRPYGIVKPDV